MKYQQTTTKKNGKTSTLKVEIGGGQSIGKKIGGSIQKKISKSAVGKLGNNPISIQLRKYDKLVKKLEKLNKDSEVALKKTVSDLKSRAPAQVTKAVTARYNIKAGEVTAAGKIAKTTATVIKTPSKPIDTVQMTYTGTLLTPTHFNMKPKSRPQGTKDENGRTIKKPKKYEVSAEIIKGQRKGLGPNVFLGGNKGGTDIPFQRKGDSRTPIQAIKTLSIPQMISNETVYQDIQKNLEELISNRVNHHVEQALKK